MMADKSCSSIDSEEIEEVSCFIVHELGHLQWPDENPEKINLCQIQRVHRIIRQIDIFAYEPFVLPIGPYHHSNSSLQFMNKLKWRCLDYILQLNCTNSLRDYLLAISSLENQARACYSGEIDLDSKSFQRMLLLDGCFILVYLTGTAGVSRITREPHDPHEQCIISNNNIHGTGDTTLQANISLENSAEQKLDTLHKIELEIVDAGKRGLENEDSADCHENSGVEWYHIYALPDLFLFENQIPFFVVRKLHEVLVGSDMETTLTESVCNYIKGNLQHLTGAFDPIEKPKNFCHLLDLLHMHFRPRMIQVGSNHVVHQCDKKFPVKFWKLFNISHWNGPHEWNSSLNQHFNFLQGGQVTRWRRATQYHEAGIVFKRKEFNGQITHSLLDVTFHDGVLEIPCLYVDDLTGSFFQNLLAFEQTNPHVGNYVSAYIMFMSQLISRPDDVTLLSQKGIIVHHLHTDKVVSLLFTQLTKGVVFDFMGNFYLRSIGWSMEIYYQSRINKWIAWLRHKHLSNPWLGLALLAGLVVLSCTIAQTVLTVLAYTRPL